VGKKLLLIFLPVSTLHRVVDRLNVPATAIDEALDKISFPAKTPITEKTHFLTDPPGA
jgi:hypothetical protein